MSNASFTSPFGANSNPFGGNRVDTGGMHRLLEEDENDVITSPTTPNFGFNTGSASGGPFGADAAADGPPSALRSPPNPEGYPAQYNFARRTSVSAESLKPVADTWESWTPPVHPKSDEQLQRLKKAIVGNFLFSHLDDEQSNQILGALLEKPIPTKGIKVSIFCVPISPCPGNQSILTLPRSSRRETLETTSTLLRGAPSMSLSTAAALCNLA